MVDCPVHRTTVCWFTWFCESNVNTFSLGTLIQKLDGLLSMQTAEIYLCSNFSCWREGIKNHCRQNKFFDSNPSGMEALWKGRIMKEIKSYPYFRNTGSGWKIAAWNNAESRRGNGPWLEEPRTNGSFYLIRPYVLTFFAIVIRDDHATRTDGFFQNGSPTKEDSEWSNTYTSV